MYYSLHIPLMTSVFRMYLICQTVFPQCLFPKWLEPPLLIWWWECRREVCLFSDVLTKPQSCLGIMSMGLGLWPSQVSLLSSRYSDSVTYSSSSPRARPLFTACFLAQAAVAFHQCPQVTSFCSLAFCRLYFLFQRGDRKNRSGQNFTSDCHFPFWPDQGGNLS